jgi:hypothetical protein
MKFFVPAAVAALGVGGAAQADVVLGTSNAYTAYGSLTSSILGIPVASYSFGPLEQISRTAPPDYNYSASTTPTSVNIQVPNPGGGLVSVQGSLLTNSVETNVDGGSGVRTTSAESSLVDGASINILGGSIVSLSLTSISQTAWVTGQTIGDSTAGGALSLLGLNLSVLGNSIVSNLNLSNTAGNVVINTGIAGLTLTLNEHIPTTTMNSMGIEANAIHLHFNSVAFGLASLTGDLIVGHTFAQQNYNANAVPEPASVAMMGLGVVGAGLAGLRRRKAA